MIKIISLSFQKITLKSIRKFLTFISIFLPKSSKLRIHYYISYFIENTNNKENELYNLKYIITKKTDAIDVGCNNGLYTYALSKNKNVNRILAFEPNKKITKKIIDYKNSKIKLYHIALSDKNTKKILKIPVVKNYELDGWASIEKNIYDKCKFKKFNQIKVKTRKLDYYKFKNIGFIKIDVEGHELSLLRGAINFFKKNKPDCLIEVKTENLTKIKKFFKGLKLNYKYVNKNKFNFLFSKQNFFFSTKIFKNKILK